MSLGCLSTWDFFNHCPLWFRSKALLNIKLGQVFWKSCKCHNVRSRWYRILKFIPQMHLPGGWGLALCAARVFFCIMSLLINCAMFEKQNALFKTVFISQVYFSLCAGSIPHCTAILGQWREYLKAELCQPSRFIS